jgi:hypothetical protein
MQSRLPMPLSRMHGGPSTGAPKGNSNAYSHGRYTGQAISERRALSTLLSDIRRLVEHRLRAYRNVEALSPHVEERVSICSGSVGRRLDDEFVTMDSSEREPELWKAVEFQGNNGMLSIRRDEVNF